MMAARYKHEEGNAPGHCKHCGIAEGAWENNVCALKPNLTAEEIEGEIDNAPLIHIQRGDDFPGIVMLAVRDEFAKAALTGIIAAASHPESGGPHFQEPGIGDVAKAAYRYADAMMDARDAK